MSQGIHWILLQGTLARSGTSFWGQNPGDTLDPPSSFPTTSPSQVLSHLLPEDLSTPLFLSIPPTQPWTMPLPFPPGLPPWSLLTTISPSEIWSPTLKSESLSLFIFYCGEFCRHKNREEYPERHKPTAQPRSLLTSNQSFLSQHYCYKANNPTISVINGTARIYKTRSFTKNIIAIPFPHLK